jgi:UDP-N-acetylmuramyl pentapeptide phosphotransferase/UDP-N-acetylglucosamine-1-phosphate transferase
MAPLLGAVLCYLPTDVRARAMMGDAGSNVLGFALGYYATTSLSLTARLTSLVFLIAIHLYTEKISLTRTIENNALLKAIDQLGRGENE